jgi:hypothetical protein
VLEWYDLNKGNFFSIWKGTGVQLQHRYSKMDDAEDNRKSLVYILETLRDSGDAVGYTIKLHKKATKEGFFAKDDQAAASESFILCEPQPYYPQPVGYAPQPQPSGEIEALKARIAALELELSEEEEEEEEEPESPISQTLGAIFTRPDIQNALIAGILGSFGNTPKPRAMAGTGSTKDEALAILAENGVTDDDLMLLAQMAVNSPAQFNWLLKSLRSQ